MQRNLGWYSELPTGRFYKPKSADTSSLDVNKNKKKWRYIIDISASELLVIFIILTTLGLWLWSLIHCINNKKISRNIRRLGIVLIVVLGIFGSIIYLFLSRSNKN